MFVSCKWGKKLELRNWSIKAKVVYSWTSFKFPNVSYKFNSEDTNRLMPILMDDENANSMPIVFPFHRIYRFCVVDNFSRIVITRKFDILILKLAQNVVLALQITKPHNFSCLQFIWKSQETSILVCNVQDIVEVCFDRIWNSNLNGKCFLDSLIENFVLQAIKIHTFHFKIPIWTLPQFFRLLISPWKFLIRSFST